MIFWSVRLHKIKTERLRPYKEEAGSPLKASGSFAHNHFQLYNINTKFFFALRTIRRKSDKDRILIYLGFCFSPADWTMHPMGALLFLLFHGQHRLFIGMLSICFFAAIPIFRHQGSLISACSKQEKPRNCRSFQKRSIIPAYQDR